MQSKDPVLYLNCDCHDLAHTLRFTFAEEDKLFYIDTLTNNLSFWQRLKYLLFGFEFQSVEVVVDAYSEKVDELINFLQEHKQDVSQTRP